MKTIVRELVYFIHFFLMVLYVGAGFIVSLQWVVVVFILVTAHQMALKGCGITILQHKYDLLPKDQEFILHALDRFFGIKATGKFNVPLELLIFYSPLIVGLIVHWQ